ncbi:hypothetical protein LWF15_29590 [Kineosporia rhizophila]|uniref:hypothetical protein n=1 Tax=Kineosporia TaxID=49184 RepID=UPI001E300F4E|nr:MULTISPECIES: hypothetical protein [Kineosporia]MCE0539660.1 hypothetical protein [Kineosporia rhizophila]GLY17912.1 hypothetical protein Kisp01_49260 [Kineosporia sp. NBRC 101677]
MSSRNTLIRSMHDLGAAAWLGGSLMGAVALNGAASDVENPDERVRIAADGWARWSPVSAAAIGAHLIGGAGLILANRDRVMNQSGVTSNTVIKSLVTVAAAATTAYSGFLGAKLAASGGTHAEGATEPAADTPDELASAQSRLRALQWAIPVLTAVIVVMGAQQGEQQRPGEILDGRRKKAEQRR